MGRASHRCGRLRETGAIDVHDRRLTIEPFLGELSNDPLDVAAIVGRASEPSCGGIGVFVGVVRESSSEDIAEPVVALEYEANPELAEDAMRAALEAVSSRWDIQRAVVVHRIGRCELGDATVVVACSAPHRADALDACHWLIDEIKATVPIWKKEFFREGSVWVGAATSTVSS